MLFKVITSLSFHESCDREGSNDSSTHYRGSINVVTGPSNSNRWRVWNRKLCCVKILKSTSLCVPGNRRTEVTFTVLESTVPSGPGSHHYRGFPITLGTAPLDEWSARRRDLYLTTHKIHNRQTPMPPGGIRTRNPSKRAAVDPHLRPRSHGAWITLATSYLTNASTTTENLTWFDPATTGSWTADVTRKVHDSAFTRVVAHESVIHARGSRPVRTRPSLLPVATKESNTWGGRTDFCGKRGRPVDLYL